MTCSGSDNAGRRPRGEGTRQQVESAESEEENTAAGTAISVSRVRERFNDFVAAHEVAWELTMALLAVVYVAMHRVASRHACSGAARA